jgi:hypothetical protein
MCAYPTD